MTTICEVKRLGLVPYREAWAWQKQLAAERAADLIPDTLLLLEHPHTYTFGRSGHAGNLLWGEEELRQRGVTVEWVDRGGDVTYHGPGQVVGYPILKVGIPVGEEGRLPQADYVGYVRKLEEMIIRAIAHFGLVTGQLNGLTGVFVHPDRESRCAFCPPEKRKAPSKIAAIGVKVDARGVTQHGFALNVEPDMDYFKGIIGCGLPDHPAISMAELLGPPPPMSEVMDELGKQFGKVFDREMHERTSVEQQRPAEERL
jgi:lipoate-protein ligase B